MTNYRTPNSKPETRNGFSLWILDLPVLSEVEGFGIWDFEIGISSEGG
jgi:hypothetical protein